MPTLAVFPRMKSMARALVSPLVAAAIVSCSADVEAAVRPQSVVGRAAQPLAGLKFSSQRFPIIIRENSDGQFQLQVRIAGRFESPESKLLLDFEPVAVEGGQFDIELAIRDATTTLEFSTVNLMGQIQTETVILQSDPPNPVREILKSLQAETSSIGVGLSGALMNYEDNAGVKFQQFGIAGKLSYSKFLTSNRRHVAAANIYRTFLPLSGNDNGLRLNLLGMNLRYGYFLGQSAGWRFWLYGGYFYSTTTSPSGRIGFRNLLGPQVYPMASRQLSRRDSIFTYFKFAPLYGLGDLSSREMAYGVSYTYRPLTGLSMSLSLDHSQITLNAGQAEIRLGSTVLGYSVGF